MNGQLILTVDVGNTSTHFGLFEVGAGEHSSTAATGNGAGNGRASVGEPRALATCELTTPAHLTADEARIQLRQILAEFAEKCAKDETAESTEALPPNTTEHSGAANLGVRGTILSCVVPSLTGAWRMALSRTCQTRPLVVGPGLKTGVPMRYDDPSEVGPDRMADAVAARAEYGAPAVVIDLGTTTNFGVIDKTGAFAGGIIAPGVALGARSLSAATARLPMVELRAPAHVIGRSTQAAIQSGVVLGEAARIDGLLSALLDELNCGQDVPLVMTGTDARRMARLLAHEVVVDDALTLRGLALIWLANQR